MSLLNAVRSQINPQNPLLLLYHKAKALLAALLYGFPANKLKVIAITGTKGKSTVSHFIARIFQEAGHKVGLASSIHFQIDETIFPNETKQTTQGPFMLQRLLREMVKARCEYAVLEVTSHALNQSRLLGVNVDVAVLTNIQRDHLEYHGGFEQYLHAKGKLFAQLAKSERKPDVQKTAVLPADDPHTAYFETFTADRTIHYGANKGVVQLGEVDLHPNGTRMVIKIPNDKIAVNLTMPGEVNIKNALAAAAAALACGINLNAIKKGLEQEVAIGGRLESVRAGQDFSVVVDYAHTEDSLEKLLSLFKPLTKGRLILVFGATGGGRDKAKRSKMGKIAATYADFIVVTDDDPYTEDRMEIINQVSEGVGRKEGDNFWKIRDRREAIRLALSVAKASDTVLVVGKGCEPIQIIGEEKIPWDDRLVVREILSSELKVAL